MKHFKTGLIVVLALAFVALFATVGTVSAQAGGPQNPSGTTPGRGAGGRTDCTGQCGMQGSNTAGTQTGILHDEMISVIADKLGITVDEINTRLADGETLSDIAYSQGLSYDDFRTLMTDARTQALTNLAEDGTITSDLADWLSQRGGGQTMSRGRGTGMGQYADPDCPYYQ